MLPQDAMHRTLQVKCWDIGSEGGASVTFMGTAMIVLGMVSFLSLIVDAVLTMRKNHTGD